LDALLEAVRDEPFLELSGTARRDPLGDLLRALLEEPLEEPLGEALAEPADFDDRLLEEPFADSFVAGLALAFEVDFAATFVRPFSLLAFDPTAGLEEPWRAAERLDG
jgi:hypothetical protein